MSKFEQGYYINEEFSVFNCNICGDFQIREIEEQLPDGCCNPECDSNTDREPAPGRKLYYMDYPAIDNPPPPPPRHPKITPDCTKCKNIEIKIVSLSGSHVDYCPPQGTKLTSDCYGSKECYRLYEEKP